MAEEMKALVIEDDSGIIESISVTFGLRWPEAKLISTMYGEKGVELVQKESPNIVILDLGLPDIDGFQVLRQIRSFSDVPVVILTVMGEELDRIKGLELGADDYIIKPFSPGEFLARIKAVVRRIHIGERRSDGTDKPFIRGNLRIDFESQEVSIGNKPLKIGPREYELLSELVTNPGQVFSNEKLLKKKFEPDEEPSIEYLRLIIKKLNERLQIESASQKIIADEGETGYKLVASRLG